MTSFLSLDFIATPGISDIFILSNLFILPTTLTGVLPVNAIAYEFPLQLLFIINAGLVVITALTTSVAIVISFSPPNIINVPG